MRKIMITGGFGFIGSNLVKYWGQKYPDDHVIVLDSLTYAARESHVLEDESICQYPHIYVDIRNSAEVRKAVRVLKPDHIIHLAAESHVCRSIDGPKDFIQTNIVGTFNLLEAFRDLGTGGRFHHVSTDEVYGELTPDEREVFHEMRRYAPRSPYAASKAASDHLVQAWHHTYDLDTVITNCSNNFGPNQHEEKLVPKAILSALRGTIMTVYGLGNQVRDWLFVNDHCSAIDLAFHKGFSGHTYCVGGDMELTNLDMIQYVSRAVDAALGRSSDPIRMMHTNDRPTDDMRYAVDSSKIQNLGWSAYPEMFNDKLNQTVEWYIKREMENKRK